MSALLFVADEWVTVGPGHEKNVGKAVYGVEVAEYHVADSKHPDHGYWHKVLEDGREFRRSVNYAASSPYGWNEVTL